MPPSRSGLQIDGRRLRTHRASRVALALIACACLALSACGESSDQSATAAQNQESAAYRQQRAQLLELVSCAHRRGIPLPPPTSSNKIDTRGVNLSGRRKAELSACYQSVVRKAERQQEAAAAHSNAGSTSAARRASAFKAEREQLMEIVGCARRHGIDLPEPNAHNRINTRGVKLRGHDRIAALNACVRQVASSAAAQESGPVVLGGPPG